MTDNLPMEITADYVRELRRSGQGSEALLLVQTQQNSLCKVKKQTLIEIYRKDYSIKKHLKICVKCNKDNLTQKVMCEKCSEKNKLYFKRYYYKKRTTTKLQAKL